MHGHWAAAMMRDLDGKRFRSAAAVRKALSGIIWERRHELPTDFRTRDLLEVISLNHWLSRDRTTGVITIVLPKLESQHGQ